MCHSATLTLLVSVGKILLPGNSVSLTYFGRACSLCVEAIRGEDGVTLHRPDSLPGPDVEEETTSSMTSALDSTSLDLSLQLSRLTVDDGDGTPGSPGGEPGPAASTPRRPPRLSPAPSPSPSAPLLTSSQDSQLSEPGERNDVSVEESAPCPLSPVEAEKALTAPPAGGTLSSDTFYSISHSTKVVLRDRRRRGGGGPSEKDTPEAPRLKVTYDTIGGLSSQLAVIRETIELPLKHPELFSSYGTCLVVGVREFLNFTCWYIHA